MRISASTGSVFFEDGGADTTHPVWGVRRVTQQQIDKERAATEALQCLPRFNCEITCQDVTSVGVSASVQTENRTRKVSVPFLTVVVQVQSGEELSLQVEPKAKKPVREHGAILRERRKITQRTGMSHQRNPKANMATISINQANRAGWNRKRGSIGK